MTSHNDALTGLLFGQGRKLLNFKMLRGDNPQVSEQELRDEANSALLQVRLERSVSMKDFPDHPEAKKVDVKEMVSQLTN